LIIEAAAKQRLADEYDAAQARGDVARLGTNQNDMGLPEQKTRPATVEEIGVTHKQVHEVRLFRDAELAEPGVVRNTVEQAIAKGEEPTKAKVRSAVKKLAKRSKLKLKKKPTPKKAAAPITKETQHERDLRVLRTLWETSCATSRAEFQNGLPEMISLKQRLSELEGELQRIRHSHAGPADRITASTAAAPNAALISDDQLDIPEFLRRKPS
jgi:hypothetical protein